MRSLFLALVFGWLVGGGAVAFAQQTLRPGQTLGGRLAMGDGALQSGELYDSYSVTARAGQRLTVRMTSQAFDPYLLVRGPNGFSRDNDDERDGANTAGLVIEVPADGVYTVSATSFRAGEQGDYQITLTEGGGGQPAAAPAGQGASIGNAALNRTPAPQQAVDGGGAGGVITPGQTVSGALGQGDGTLSSGEFRDSYRLQGRAGDVFTIRLASTAFDPYLLVRGPGGLQQDNDDDESERGSHNSRIVATLTEDGELTIAATSYRAGESGAYTLSVVRGGPAASAVAAAPAPSGPRLTLGRAVSGTLAEGDGALRSGEFYDSYALTGRQGQTIELRLTSAAVDPYVMISGPGGFSAFNDDDPAGGKNSRLVVTLPAAGEYRVQATSYAARETGAYQLTVSEAAAPATAAVAALAIGGTARGQLAATDERSASGARADRFRFSGRAGQRVEIDMRSTAFDTLVHLESPSGGREQNDDAGQGVTNSHLETVLAETGDYTIVATSYAADGLGAYEVSLNAAAGGGRETVAAGGGASAGTIAPGAAIAGRLQQGDATLQSGELRDEFTFVGRRWQSVTIDMASSEFDSYVIVQAPSGTQKDNDDAVQGQRDSRVVWTLPEDGRYRILATSYRAGEFGAYTLRYALGGTPAPVAGARGKVFAVMVGISDYGGEGDLNYTADDARKMSETLRRDGVLAPESVLIVDGQATRAAVIAAFNRVAAAAGPDDMFLFFYSGHGGQVAQRGAATGEPDGRDETIVMRDGVITDDEMAQMFRQVRARVSLIALDSCFSGGFARDVIAQPGVMGLFSSEEDLTSAVADKFEAGGYLSHFLRSGLGGDADSDTNKVVTAGELSAYLRRQFAEHAAGVQAETMERQQNYQFLVVERGGVKIDDPLIALP